MPPMVYLQKKKKVRRVPRVLDRRGAQSMCTRNDLGHVLISLICRTPTFVSKGAENAATPQDEGEEDDAMNEDGESIEEDSSSDLDDDEGDIPVYGSRRPRENIEEEEEEEPPTRGLGAFRRDLGMTDANDVPPITPENEPEPPKGAGIGFKRGTGLPSTLQSEEPAVIPATKRGIGSSTPLSHATDSSTMSTESLPTSFGASRTQRAFVRAAPTQAAPIPKAELSMEERAHFAKISGTFGAKMMAKMGWSAVSPFIHQYRIAYLLFAGYRVRRVRTRYRYPSREQNSSQRQYRHRFWRFQGEDQTGCCRR